LVFFGCAHGGDETARYRSRAGGRAAGHFDEARTDDELWSPEVTEPVAGGWPVVVADTNEPVDLGRLVAEVERLVVGNER
jgi:hypothetical protein